MQTLDNGCGIDEITITQVTNYMRIHDAQQYFTRLIHNQIIRRRIVGGNEWIRFFLFGFRRRRRRSVLLICCQGRGRWYLINSSCSDFRNCCCVRCCFLHLDDHLLWIAFLLYFHTILINSRFYYCLRIYCACCSCHFS